jgi:MCM N-terminal domain
MTADQRAKADAVIRARQSRVKRTRRDRRKRADPSLGGLNRLPQALQEMSSSEEDDRGFDELLVRHRGAAGQQRQFISPDDPEAREAAMAFEPELFEEGDADETIELEEPHGRTRDWIVMDGPRRAIAKRFHKFLANFQDEHGHRVYPNRITRMCAQNRTSLEVSYEHLSAGEDTEQLARWLAEQPTPMLAIFDEVAKRAVMQMFSNYVNNIAQEEIRVRIFDVPSSTSLRDLRQHHLDCLVKVHG